VKPLPAILGFGAERIQPPADASRADLVERRRMMLARALNLKTTVAFIGSGCSAAFGYPDWRRFALIIVTETLQRLKTLSPSQSRDLNDFRKRLRTDKDDGTERELMHYLGYCQNLAETHDDARWYHETIARTFRSAKKKTPHDVYSELLKLPIERFITTNYDTEIERALRDADKVEWDEFAIGKPPDESSRSRARSFTQKPAFYHQVAAFALAGIPDTKHLVFHCHGRWDDPDSIIATEKDYQRWYLDERQPSLAAFRQSMELLFGSNPILFLGFGMADEDLLRTLRTFSAIDPRRKWSRPLFALVEEESQQYLYERYGIHVIPYRKRPPASDPDSRAQQLCEELRLIRKEWLERSAEWRRKPVIRTVVVEAEPPALYQHYAPVVSDADTLAPARMKRDIQELREKCAQPGVVVITGYGGSGKSWRVLHLLRLFEEERCKRQEQHRRWDDVRQDQFEGLFFWSSYYTDDWLTGLDRALAYLEKRPADDRRRSRRETRRLERFAKCVERPYLLVFDGFERLLRESNPTEGTPYHPAVTKLLEGAAKGNATVILTSRLMPDVLKAHEASGRARRYEVKKLTSTDLAEGGEIARLVGTKVSLEDLSRLCSLCDGHSYALALAAGYLARAGFAKGMETLCRRLADTSPTHRVSRVIQMTVEDVDARTKGAASALLERLAIFMTPATEQTLQVCHDAVREQIPAAPSLEKTRKALLDAHLVFSVSTLPAGSAPMAFTVHPTVRAFMFNRLQKGCGEMPNFALAGFTSGSAVVAPGSRQSAEHVRDLFDRLAKSAEEHRGTPLGKELCRSAFGVVRSRMEANTAPRWCSYDEYMSFGIRSAMLAKANSPATWDFRDRSCSPESPHGVLFADELAWLYSDVGLALYSEGNMFDAYSVWESSYEIDRVTDNEDESGQYIVQSRLHMAAVYLEMGNLPTANEYLDICEKANAIYNDPDYRARIDGYRALLRHLGGSLSGADVLYANAIKRVESPGGRNLRAESIFKQHWGDLKMAMGDLPEAERLIRESRSAAEEGEHRDLIAYARCSSGHLHRVKREFPQAQIDYNTALHVAQQSGIRRLESDVYSEMSRLALALGDWETARRRAVQSLMIANSLSLGLRRTHGLMVLGLANTKAGNHQLGAAYLLHALRLALHQRYHLREQEAARELAALGIEPTAEGWA
jgi:tetratricopeptide (TPR) repeat protein